MTLTPNKCIDSCCDGCGCNVTKEDIGLGNVDNTSDVNKPISTAVQNALSQKASATTVSNIANNLSAVEGRVSAIEGTFVTLSSTQSISGDKTFNGETNVPNTTLGDSTAKAVNGDRLMAEISALTGYVTVATVQSITGNKNFTGSTQFSGNVQVDGVTVVNGAVTFNGSTTFSALNVPNTSVGDTSAKAVNGTRLMAEINSLTGFVTLSGNQTILGNKTFSGVTTFANDVTANDITCNGTADFTSVINVPNTSVGNTTTKAVNGKRVVDELNNYAPMVRTSGNQVISGIKYEYNVYYQGDIGASSDDPTGTYTDIATLGATGAAHIIGLTIISRYGAFKGLISVNSGFTTITKDGAYMTNTGLSIGLCTINGVVHLVGRRLTAANQRVTINIDGVTRGFDVLGVTPTNSLTTVSGVTDYIEAIQI